MVNLVNLSEHRFVGTLFALLYREHSHYYSAARRVTHIDKSGEIPNENRG